jgi:hypothetical protein
MLLYNGRIKACLGPPAPPMGPKAPGGGELPRPPVSRSGQMGPEPALGLAIRPAGVWARASGEAIRRGPW